VRFSWSVCLSGQASSTSIPFFWGNPGFQREHPQSRQTTSPRWTHSRPFSPPTPPYKRLHFTFSSASFLACPLFYFESYARVSIFFPFFLTGPFPAFVATLLFKCLLDPKSAPIFLYGPPPPKFGCKDPPGSGGGVVESSRNRTSTSLLISLFFFVGFYD